MDTSGRSILGRLASSDVDERRLALTEQEELLEVAAYQDLVPLLDDEDATVRKLTIQLLEELGDSRALPDLLKAAADSDPDVSSVARTAVREFKTKESTDALLNG